MRREWAITGWAAALGQHQGARIQHLLLREVKRGLPIPAGAEC